MYFFSVGGDFAREGILLGALGNGDNMGIQFFYCMFPFILQKGHVLRLLFTCQRCRLEKRTWSSSLVFGARYLLNQKSVLYIYIYIYMLYMCWNSAYPVFEILQVCWHGTCWLQIHGEV